MSGGGDTSAVATVYCSFCGKSQHEVESLLTGSLPTYICNECVVLCGDIIAEKSAARPGAAAPVLTLEQESRIRELIEKEARHVFARAYRSPDQVRAQRGSTWSDVSPGGLPEAGRNMSAEGVIPAAPSWLDGLPALSISYPAAVDPARARKTGARVLRAGVIAAAVLLLIARVKRP